MNNKTEFGMRMARQCILKEINNGGQKNFVMSPLLVHIALNMLASASTSRTLKQLLHVLESESITDLNAQSSLIMELANSGGKGLIISFTNGVWVYHRFPVKNSFKQVVEDVYEAKAESVDFVNRGEEVRDEINSWAKEASKGHIDPFLPPKFFTPDDIALLASAIYFNGTWAQIFHPKETRDGDFHLLNGHTVRVPFMNMYYRRHLYGSFDGFKLLKMKYKSNESDSDNGEKCKWVKNSKMYAMYIFLPDKRDGLQELIEKFCSDPGFLIENREVQKVLLLKLCVPKLKFEYKLNAVETMKDLGLDLPFDDKEAEITEMVHTQDIVYISKAIQKSYIEVNEQGTTATSIFGYSLRGGGGPLIPPPSFVADHPFLLMIKEEVSGIILFVGAALNPGLEILNEKVAVSDIPNETVGGKKRKMNGTKEERKKQKD